MFITILSFVLWTQFWLLTFSVFLPCFCQYMYWVFYGLARLLNKKWSSSQNGISKPNYLVSPLVFLLDRLAYIFALTLDLIGRLYHSYEGIENIPTDRHRPALLIFYHGVMPSDMLYLPIRVYLKSGRLTRSIADRRLFYYPLWWLPVINYIYPGPPEKCVSTLKHGHLLQIAVGGARECLFSTFRYEVLWKNRCGFARVAKEAGVDVIPVFTRNIRQMFYMPEFFQWLFRPVYEKLSFPFVPFVGGYPVKLKTYVGKPIKCDSVESAEELAVLVRKTMEELIETHQMPNATITSAVCENFNQIRKTKRCHFA